MVDGTESVVEIWLTPYMPVVASIISPFILELEKYLVVFLQRTKIQRHKWKAYLVWKANHV